jgi:hypothetical protein
LWSRLSISSWATSISGWSIGALGANGASWARLGHAFALGWDRQQFLVLASILAWASLVTIFAWLSITSVLARLASWTRWSALAGAASADFGVGLPSRTHESAEGGLGALARAASVSLVDVQHFFPHITRA